MCGIVGYIGGKNAIPIVIEGLQRLEYRGYDSAGVAVLVALVWLSIRRRLYLLREPGLRESPLLAAQIALPVLAMTTLLVGTFGFFGVHTLLWLPRSFQAMRHSRHLRKNSKEIYFRRFAALPRYLHIIVITSFLGLAITGMTLIASGRGSGQTALPFGAFLAPAGVLVLMAGPVLWRGYLMLAGF